MSKKIRFQIEELAHQEEAVRSVTDLLKGIVNGSAGSIYSSEGIHASLGNPRPEANIRFAAGERLVRNLQNVQYRNGLFKDDAIVGNIPQFTVEMETGTGKTLVYLETILRLWSGSGGMFKKFIIVVPSNPILMGVKKSIGIYADHFRRKYSNIDISQHFFVFDKSVSPETAASKLVESTGLSIMLLTNHSFNKEQNRLRKAGESGTVVWEEIKGISPVVILDEPQKMDGNGRKRSASLKAVEELDPTMILRYSATHRNLYNPVYKLDSYDAYKKNLVKGIRVITVHSLTPKDFPYVRYVGFTSGLQARIEIFRRDHSGNIRSAKYDADAGASLEELSGGLPQYRNWYIAAQPRKNAPLQISTAETGILLLEEGRSNDNSGSAHSAAAEKQMEIAIKAHIRKQAEILAAGKKIKVLTLIFVDSVAKVRGEGGNGRGEYLQIFDRVFENIRSQRNIINSGLLQKYPKELAVLNPDTPVTKVREGYFAVDRKNREVEVEGWDSGLSDEDVVLKAKAQEDVERGIDLILNKKDELISFDEPLSFIFSHSALREGWDNPNVFVLVTLKEGGSDIAKKQEVGRGLRLPVDINGARCSDRKINELTVVANDYYDHFADSLQRDFNESSGFDRNEVSPDIVRLTITKAGIPADKAEGACDAFRRELLASGAVKADKSGKLILTKAAEKIPELLFKDPVLIEYSDRIRDAFVQVMQDKGSKNIRIINGDEEPFANDVREYSSGSESGNIKKNPVHICRIDKEEFISKAAAEIEIRLAKKNDHIRFEITSGSADFSETKKMHIQSARKRVEDSSGSMVQYEPRHMFELVNAIMFRTMLPRLAIIKIINKLSDTARNKLSNQEHLEEAVSVIDRQLKLFRKREQERS